MRKNNMKLAVAMTLAVFTMMTALVTMQTTAAFAGITQVNTSKQEIKQAIKQATRLEISQVNSLHLNNHYILPNFFC